MVGVVDGGDGGLDGGEVVVSVLLEHLEVETCVISALIFVFASQCLFHF